MLVNAEMNVT